MTPSEKVYGVVSKPWFFNEKPKHNSKIANDYLQKAASIIAKSKKLLTLMKDDDVRKTLHAIMEQTDQLLRMTTKLDKIPSEEQLHFLLSHCQQLQTEALNLPESFPAERNLAELNYKIAAACFYLLVISFCLAAGAAFGAAYFGFLTAAYFADTLVGVLTVIGIPATCLGLVSYGLYSAESSSQEDYTTIADEISEFCDTIVADYELAPEQDLECSI